MKNLHRCTQSGVHRSCSRRPRLRETFTPEVDPSAKSTIGKRRAFRAALAMENPQGRCESVAGVAN